MQQSIRNINRDRKSYPPLSDKAVSRNIQLHGSNALCEIKSAYMRKREGCRGAETCTSIKSQEIDITIGRKSLLGRNRPDEKVFATKIELSSKEKRIAYSPIVREKQANHE